MNRREFVFYIALGLFISGCQKPKGRKGYRIEVQEGESLVLIDNITGASFYLHKNATLDLNGYTINGNDPKEAKKVHQAITAHSGASVLNGTIEGYINGISVVSELADGYLDALKLVSKKQAKNIGDKYRNENQGGAKIINVDIDGCVSHAVYFQAFTTDSIIDGCIFNDTGLMHIYVDHGCEGHSIQNSSFFRCGFSHWKGREGIALDSCVDIVVGNNLFEGRMKLRAISAYTNKGENSITREICRGHKIKNNVFRNLREGVGLASRGNYCENVELIENRFENVGLPFFDKGEGNIISNNIAINR